MSVNLGLTVKEFVHGQFGKINFSSHCNRKMNYERVSVVWQPPGGGEGGGTPHMKVGGMLVVSLRDVNFGFWSHLGCSGQNVIIFSREGLV